MSVGSVVRQLRNKAVCGRCRRKALPQLRNLPRVPMTRDTLSRNLYQKRSNTANRKPHNFGQVHWGKFLDHVSLLLIQQLADRWCHCIYHVQYMSVVWP